MPEATTCLATRRQKCAELRSTFGGTAAERAAAYAPAAVAVDDDPAGDAGVGRRATVNEAAGRVHKQCQLVVHRWPSARPGSRTYGDPLLSGGGAEWRHDGGDSRIGAVIGERDLRLAVGAQKIDLPTLRSSAMPLVSFARPGRHISGDSSVA